MRRVALMLVCVRPSTPLYGPRPGEWMGLMRLVGLWHSCELCVPPSRWGQLGLSTERPLLRLGPLGGMRCAS